MSRPLLKLLEALGRIGVPFGTQETKFAVGRPDGLDSANSHEWRRYLESMDLWSAWGPAEGSPWEPFHCVTLFAALDELKRDMGGTGSVGPLANEPLPDHVMQGDLPDWAAPGNLVIVDLPGPQSVALAARLVTERGYQPVCTFDNWPHQLAVLRTELVLATLLYYAGVVAKSRERLRPESPPVWICDRLRFTGQRPPPGRFDNRYIIEDRLLPGDRLLRKHGIRRVVYVCPLANAQPSEDLRPWLDELMPLGIPTYVVGTGIPLSWRTPAPYVRKFVAKSGWSPMSLGLMRSSAGGFGGFVPQQSSGG